MAGAEPPPRTRVCLQCRTALVEGEACDVDPDHEVAGLGTDAGREALVRTVWGPPPVRVRERAASEREEQAVWLFGFCAFAVTLLVSAVLAPPLGLGNFLGALIVGALFRGLASTAAKARARTFPRGGAPALPAAPHRGPVGVVSGERRLVSPATGVACVGWLLELAWESRGDRRVMYRDGVTGGFDVDLRDEGLIRIPPGRLRLVAEMRQVIDVDNPELEAYLASVDPEHRPGAAFDPFRYDVVYEEMVLPGDVVEVVSDIEPEVDPDGAETDYRTAAPSILVPSGVPVVRLVQPASR